MVREELFKAKLAKFLKVFGKMVDFIQNFRLRRIMATMQALCQNEMKLNPKIGKQIFGASSVPVLANKIWNWVVLEF